MTCPRCQHKNLPTMKFCGECGTPLQRPEADAPSAPSYADLQRVATEALEQQTATADILKIISTSPTDIQPVLDAVAESAARLCESVDAEIFRREGDQLLLVAHHGPIPSTTLVVPLVREAFNGRTVLDGRTFHVADLQAETDVFPRGSRIAQQHGTRAQLSVPLMREGVAIGTISLRRTEARLFTDRQVALLQTFADQAVIAIENVRLFKELEARNRDLTEALEQQTATSEILRVISQSPTHVQPVVDAIAERACCLCDAFSGIVVRLSGETVELAAQFAFNEAWLEIARRQYPHALHRYSIAGRAMLERRIVHVRDLEAEPEFKGALRLGRAGGYRSVVFVPMLRDNEPIGAIGLTRREGGFTDNQIALLKTFADQAVIAIENVRLFTELEARNRDLMATSAILQVISSSPTNVQPVFDAIVDKAAKLGDGLFSTLISFDGELMRLEAAHNWTSEAFDHLSHGILPAPPSRSLPAGRAILGRTVIHLPDIELDQEFRHPELPRAVGFRSVLSVPMLRDSVPLGAISVARAEPGPFSDNEIDLLKTFADQAVIAIENVRLFRELEARNRDLTTALDTQTATSDILRVISMSQTEVQPVFDAILASGVRLCGARFGSVFRFDGELIYLVASYEWPAEQLEVVRRRFPMPPGDSSLAARAIRDRRVVQTPDYVADSQAGTWPEWVPGGEQRPRSTIAIPMLREGNPVGAIALARSEPGLFSDQHLALLQTFADQAVIAIENVRLFKELETRTTELTQSVEQLTALGEVSRAVTSTLDVEAVLDTVVSRARQLAGADGCLIYEYDEATQQFHSRATDNLDAAYAEALRGAPIRKGEGVSGRAAEMREPVQVADMTQPSAYQSSVRDITLRAGFRAVLSVPLLREDEIIGSLILIRKTPGEFSAEIVELLKTFATQSALAIQNARLFREIADKSSQLEAASRHKSEFLANMSHELRTPLNAIIGFSEVLNERMFGELNEKQDEYLKDIYASGQHLLSLINDILDLSKIEAGRMELEVADFDLPSAIDNALMLVRERAIRRGIILGRAIDDRVGMIRGDERKVKQVLLNLLSNALKFTPEGGRIDVRAAMTDGMAEISVTDTGVGIAPEDQEAIFEEFRQVGTADKKVEGTGLGLALSRKFIELHGGRIWVKSQSGEGSTFTFTLPVGHAE